MPDYSNITSPALFAGERAESCVLTALAQLPLPWQIYPTIEWRLLTQRGESIGEADMVVFHPHLGIVVLEIKAGSVTIRDGQWYYASGQIMKQSPFSQARRNRYALSEKLAQRLGANAMASLTITHGVWFPEVSWHAPLPGAEAPSRAFLLDRQALAQPEVALKRLFREAVAEPVAWSRRQQQQLKDLLAPDCQQLVPLAHTVECSSAALYQATKAQLAVLRVLRRQSRLLIEGGAGTGKTLLAVTLAKEHAAQGKTVLLTCYNRHLALYLQQLLVDIPAIQVNHFHELVRLVVEQAGFIYQVPEGEAAKSHFFREEAAELLLTAAESLPPMYDTLIIDEAADFDIAWWIALEALGRPGYAWYCFYDRQQGIYQDGHPWEPPFNAEPYRLDTNLRNTRAIGELAAQLGQVRSSDYRVDEGVAPIIDYYADFAAMAVGLRQRLQQLLHKEQLNLGQIVILSPYRHTNPQSTWVEGLRDYPLTTEMVTSTEQLRVGTIHGFKGLEADVVILVGITKQAAQHPDWLYVGASRARSLLCLLALAEVTLPIAKENLPHDTTCRSRRG
ncbi:MAG: ATP-binding domain-containing protein [Gammaproteobacteria bacterium]|nr:ATP-binding domain-containing protein [Gammaproteobacteria bacterium]